MPWLGFPAGAASDVSPKSVQFSVAIDTKAGCAAREAFP